MAESSEESPRLAEDVVPSGIDPARGDRPRRAVLVAGAAVVLALGAAASFPGLGLRDLTADEIGQFHGLGPLGMESRAVDPERFGAHMPLAFQLRWVALAVLGESSAAAWRIHAALGACLGALATFWIVARRGGIGAAVAAGAVVATSPILSFHAHESSNYALAPLTGALTLAGLAELSGKGRAGPWLLGAGLLLGVRNDMFFAFPGAAAAIATAALVYRSRRRARLARRAAWAWAPALGVFAAQAAVFLVRLARLEGSAFDRVIVPHADAGSPEAAAPLAVVARTVTGFAAAYADGYRDAGSVDPWIVAGPVAVLLACAALALARRRGDPLVRSALLLLLGSLGVFVAARLGFTLASGRAFSGGARVFLALLPALAIVVARGGAAAGPVLGPALVLGWLSVQGLATARQVLAVSDGDHRVAARLAREWREGDVILAPATLRARLPETIAGRAPEPPCLRPGEPLPSRVWHVTQPGSPLISGVNTCDGPPKDLVADHGYVPRLVEPWRAPEYEARSNSYLSGVQLVLLEAGTVPAPAVPARRALRFEPAPLSGAKGGRLHVDWVTDAERRTLVDAPFTPELDLEVPDAPGGRIEVTLFPGPPPAWATKDRTGLSHPLGNSVSGWDPRAILASPIDATMVFPLSPLADARLRVGIRALHGALGLVAAASLATAALAPWVGRLRRRLAARPRGGDGDAGGSEPPRDPAPAEAAPPPSHSAAEEPPPVPDPPAPVAEEEPEPPPSPSGWAGVLPDVAICGVLVALGLALRLPVVPHMELTSDGIDPLKEALLVREGRRFFVEHSFLFGYGRAWSFLPLVAGDPGGLLGMGARRAVAQTLVPPLVYLATRLLMGRSPLHLGRRVGPLIAAAAVLTNHGLFETLVTGHQTYFGVEWGSLYVLGLAALVSGRALVPAALLAGAALPMMAMNHPFAAAGAGALLPVLAGAWGTRRWRGLGAFALLCVVALAVGWPHLRHVLFTPHGGAAGFVQQARDSAGGESLSALQVLDLLLAGRLRKGGGLLVFGPVAALAFGIGGALLAGSRPDSRARAARVALFGLGALLCIGLAVALGVMVNYVQRYHWRPLLPLLAVATGGGVAVAADLVAGPWARGRPHPRTRWIRRALGGGLLAAASWYVLIPARGLPELLFNFQSYGDAGRSLARYSRLGDLLERADPEGPWVVAGFGHDGSRTAEVVAVVIDRVLRGTPRERFPVHWDEMAPAATLLVYRSSPEDTDRLLGVPLPEGVRVLDGGPSWFAHAARDAAAARAWTRGTCALQPGLVVRPEDPFEYLTVTAPNRASLGQRPYAHPCLEALRWSDVNRTSFPADPRSLPAGHPPPPKEGRYVEAGPFRLSTLEVSRREWRACVDAGACRAGPEEGDPWEPVTGVAAPEAEAYCAFTGGDLPTTFEWEAGALWSPGGRPGRVRFPWGDEWSPDRANAAGAEDGFEGAAPVGAFPGGRSGYGVEDMVGNVAEWTRSAILVPGDGVPRPEPGWTVRGGSHGDPPDVLELWNRREVPGGQARPDVGFRCVRR